MEKMSPQPQRSPSIAPLARDADGNLIELPDGAVGWRIRRQTGGRPRLVLDHRKQPMLFPLDYTIADVEDVLAPGSYLLDAVDKDGEPLGVTIAVSIGMTRNGGAEPIEPESENVASAPLVVPTTLPNTTSDVRLVLEANVRATQMAFIHNQRTLEIGLRMAETLRDGVQVLASSQADWIKSVSSARGFFRNAAAPMAPVEVKQLTVNTGNGDDGGDDGDEEDGGDGYVDGEPSDDGNGGGGGAPHWSDKFMPIITQVMTQVMPAINAWSSKQYSDARARRAGAPARNAADQKLEEQQAEEQPAAQDEEQQLAQEQQERFAEIAGAIAAASSRGTGIDIIKLMQLLPQRTSTKIMQLQLALSPDEQVDAMQILKSYRADDLADLINVIDQAGLEQCKGFLRGLIVEWRGIQAARRARAKTDDGGTGGAGGPGGVSGAPAAAGGVAGGSGTGEASGLGHASGSGRANGGGGATGVGGAVGPRAARRSSTVGSASGTGGASGSGATGIISDGAARRALGDGRDATADGNASAAVDRGALGPGVTRGGGGSGGTNGNGSAGS